MNQRKTNNALWYSLGLAVLLCVALLVIATGTTLARYRSEREEVLTFEVRAPNQICLGTVRPLSEEEAAEAGLEPGTLEIFDPGVTPEWKSVEDEYRLELAVANGISDTEFFEEDQQVRLRLVGTLGLWTDAGVAEIYLRLPPEEDGGEDQDLKAETTSIESGTALHNTHGDGWVYSFRSEEGEELTWTLPGGKLSYVTLTVVMKGAVPSNPSLLQPQIIAERISE